MPDEIMDEEEAEIRAKHPLVSAMADAFEAIGESVDLWVAVDDSVVLSVDAYAIDIGRLEEELTKRFTLGRKADE